MGVNKIEINTGNGKETLINISDSTVTPETLTEGYTAYGANGEPVNGINPYELNATNAEVNTQADLIEQIQAALVGKSTFPEGYVKPSGTMEITENGTYDVTNYAAVEVNVEGSGGEAPSADGVTFGIEETITVTEVDNVLTPVITREIVQRDAQYTVSGEWLNAIAEQIQRLTLTTELKTPGDIKTGLEKTKVANGSKACEITNKAVSATTFYGGAASEYLGG